MGHYYKKQPLNVYVVSAQPTSFWRRLMKFLPYNVGQKVQLKIVIKSKRDRGMALMDLKYFEFVEIMPDGQQKTIMVDEKRITVNKHDGIIYPQTTTPISREGIIEWKLVDVVSHDQVLLFTDNVVFLHSSKDIMRLIFAVIGFISGIIATLLFR